MLFSLWPEPLKIVIFHLRPWLFGMHTFRTLGQALQNWRRRKGTIWRKKQAKQNDQFYGHYVLWSPSASWTTNTLHSDKNLRMLPSYQYVFCFHFVYWITNKNLKPKLKFIGLQFILILTLPDFTLPHSVHTQSSKFPLE